MIETLSQKVEETNKLPHNFRDSERVRYPFYFAAKEIESTKSGNNVKGGDIFDSSEDQQNYEQEDNLNSRKYGGSISKLIIFGREKRFRKPSSDQSKKLNKGIPYLYFKMEGLSLLKEIRLPGDLMYKVEPKDSLCQRTLRNMTGSNGKAF